MDFDYYSKPSEEYPIWVISPAPDPSSPKERAPQDDHRVNDTKSHFGILTEIISTRLSF